MWIRYKWDSWLAVERFAEFFLYLQMRDDAEFDGAIFRGSVRESLMQTGARISSLYFDKLYFSSVERA